MRYFVMLHTQKGENILPLVHNNEDVMLFDNEYDAIAAAESNILGDNFGFEIYDRSEASYER